MFEEMLLRWHALENAACAAEDQVRRAGQGAASPEFAALTLEAQQLRDQANALLAELRAMVPKS